MKYKIISLIYILSAVQCTSVQTAVSPKSANILPPVVTPAEYSDQNSDQFKSDYKMQERGKGPYRIVPVMEKPDAALINDAVASALKAKFFRNFAIKEVELIHPQPELPVTQDNLKDPAVQKFFADNQIDGVVFFSVQPAGGSVREGMTSVPYKTVYRLIDPVNGSELAQTDRKAVYYPAREDASAQLELYRSAEGFYFFRDSHYSRMQTESLSPVTVREFLRSSISSQVDIFSSSPEAEVQVVRKDGTVVYNGKPPVNNLTLDQGTYKVLVKRPGRSSGEESVHIRAGKKEAVFLTWEDDPDRTNLAFYSIPPGQRVALDGIIQGDTPFFRIAVMPGVYETELSQKEKSGEYTVNHFMPVEISQGSKNDVIFLDRLCHDYTKELKEEDQAAFRLFWVPSSKG
jgi:hypothetical protein